MSNASLTGSEVSRFNEISNYWLAFEPISNEDYSFISPLYTVPLGQDFAPTLTINSGSYSMSGGAILIEKDIHIFDDEDSFVEFMTEIGQENVVSYIERETIDSLGAVKKYYEVHVVSYPTIKLSFEYNNFIPSGGFFVKVLKSSSLGLEEVFAEEKYDSAGRLISEPYTKYFSMKNSI